MRHESKISDPKLVQTFYVDMDYSQNHAHMPHVHKDALELLYVAEGEGRYIVGKKGYTVAAGDVVVCNAGILHGEAPEQKIQTYCCVYQNVKVKGLPDNHLTDRERRPVVNMGDMAEYLKYLVKMLHEMFQSGRYDRQICAHLGQAVFLLVWDQLLKYRENGQEGGNQQKKRNQEEEELVKKIREYIDRHYMEKLTLDSISERFYISTSGLSHLFKREMGVSPMQYAAQRRIGEAQSLLMGTDIPIHVIEEQLGFGSECHFSIMFKKYVGISPKEYRRHFRKCQRQSSAC